MTLRKQFSIAALILFLVASCFFVCPVEKKGRYQFHSSQLRVIETIDENIERTDYVNSDGLNISQYAKLLQRTFDNFPDINTKVEVLDITPNTKYAIAYISEIKHATTKSESKITNDKGNFKSEEKKIIYLEEFNGIWKIYSDNRNNEYRKHQLYNIIQFIADER